MPGTNPKSKTSPKATDRSSGSLRKKTLDSHSMSRDIRQTILSRIDPERVSVAIDVESLSTAPDSSSMFLPFPPITSLDDKKNTDQQKKEDPKKSHGEFVSPAPRPPHGTASSSAPNPELASIVDNEKNDDQKKGVNEEEPLNVDHLNSRSSTRATFGEAAPSQPPIDSNHDHVSVGSGERPLDSMAEDGQCVSDSRHAFASPSPNTTPAKATRVNTHDDTAPLPFTPPPLAPPMILDHNPIKALAQRTFRPQGALPTGFPEPRDLTKDVQGGKIPVKAKIGFPKLTSFPTPPPHTMIPHPSHRRIFWRPSPPPHKYYSLVTDSPTVAS